MNDLFQDFIACLLNDKKYYPYYVKADQFRDHPGKKKKNQTITTAWKIAGRHKSIRPDIITYKDSGFSEIHAIIDAKYKDDKDVYDAGKWKQTSLAESDMYQIAFYLNDYPDFKKKIAYAVLPKHEKSRDDYEIKAIKEPSSETSRPVGGEIRERNHPTT